jgi:hypothetical protein
MPAAEAVIATGPAARPVAAPALLIAALAEFDELQFALALRSCVLLSLYVPITWNCCVPPITTAGPAGFNETDTSTAGFAVTFRVVDPDMEPEVAMTLAWPAATPVTIPVLIALAIVFAEVLQVTLDVTFFEVLSL